MRDSRLKDSRRRTVRSDQRLTPKKHHPVSLSSSLHPSGYGARGAVGSYSRLGDQVADEMFGGRKRRAKKAARQAAIAAARAELKAVKAIPIRKFSATGFGQIERMQRLDLFDDDVPYHD